MDLHARPAADFVRTAMGFGASITVGANGREADAKSLLSVLALGAKGGTTLSLGPTARTPLAAVEALAGCVCRLELARSERASGSTSAATWPGPARRHRSARELVHVALEPATAPSAARRRRAPRRR